MISLLIIVLVLLQENTFQAILITDGNYSYAVFTYNCDLMEWDNGVTIGFGAGTEIYANHDPSTSAVACLNRPETDWSNIVYLLSNDDPELPPPSMHLHYLKVVKLCNDFSFSSRRR